MAVLLFKQIVSLFIMMGAGFVIVKTKLARSEDSRLLSVLSMYLIMPCAVLKAFQIEVTPQIQKGFLVALCSACLIHIFLLVFDLLAKRLFRLDAVERSSIMYSNAGNLIIPLVTALLGEQWLIYASAFMCVQLVFLWTHAISLISGQNQLSLKKIVTNVNLITVLVGLIMMLFKIRLPEILNNTVAGISATIGPVSMIMMGMILANVDFKKILKDLRVYLTVFLKMILGPVLVMLVLWLSHLASLVPDGKTILMISYLAVITPPAATITQMAQFCRNRPEHASAINALGTVVCIGTMPMLVWLFERII